MILLFELLGFFDGVATSLPSTPSTGAQGTGYRWTARIHGRYIHGTREEVEAALRIAAQADAKADAANVDTATSNRGLRRTARTWARESLAARDLLGELIAQAQQAQQSIAQVAQMRAAMARAYLAEYERALIAQARQAAAEDAEDFEDINLILSAT